MSEYSDMVKALAKPGGDIVGTMNPDDWRLLDEACRILITAGNTLDQVKKQVIYRKAGDITPSLPNSDVPLVNASQAHLLHMVVGIAGEAAELLEAVHNHIYQGEDLDRENAVEELGDLEFYMEGTRQGLELDRKTVLDHNQEKLSKRYHGGKYADQEATERADKPLVSMFDKIRSAHTVIMAGDDGAGTDLLIKMNWATLNLLKADPATSPHFVLDPVIDAYKLLGMEIVADEKMTEPFIIIS